MSEAAVAEKQALTLTDMPHVHLDNLTRVQMGFDPVTGKLERLEGIIKGTSEKTVYSDLQNPKGIYTNETYYPSGRLQLRCRHANYSNRGAASFYYDLDGSPLKETCYYNAKLQKRVGTTIKYATDGKTETDHYKKDKNGNYIGDYLLTQEDGSRVQSIHDKKTGLNHHTVTAADGRVLRDISFNADGKKVGKYIDTNKKNERIEAVFSDDGRERRVGPYRHTTADGRVLKDIPYNSKGNPDGLVTLASMQSTVSKAVWKDGEHPDRITYETLDGILVLDAPVKKDLSRLTGRIVKGFLDGSKLEGTIDDTCSDLSRTIDTIKLCTPYASLDKLESTTIHAFIGEVVEKWPNGGTKSVYTLVKEKSRFYADQKIRHGFYADYYEDGSLKRVGDTRSGEEYTYTADGKPETHTIGFDGRVTDKVSWSEQGAGTLSVYDEENRERIRIEFNENGGLVNNTRYNKNNKALSAPLALLIHMVRFNEGDIAEKAMTTQRDDAINAIKCSYEF